MDKQDVDYAKWCIENDIHKFYIWPKWIKTREEVLMLDRYECQDCKKRGYIKRATTVHHNRFVKRYPELSLEIYYHSNGIKKRNLISLCHSCHEARHNYRKKAINYLTEERW